MKEKTNDLSELKGLGKIILILAGAFIIGLIQVIQSLM